MPINQVQTKPKGNPMVGWILLVVLLAVPVVLLSKLNFSEQQVQQNKDLVTGKILQKLRSSGGGVKLVVEKPDYTQVIVLVTADVLTRERLLVGETLQFRVNKLGEDVYTVNNDKDIRSLIAIDETKILQNVQVKKSKAYFQNGPAISFLPVDLPDGHYKVIVVTIDSDNNVNVLASER